ncbi:MAG: transglycosylase family protein [Arachnia sp.]
MLKRSLQVIFLALFGAVFGVVSTQGASALEPTVYNQPGDHLVNGRYWKTSCEMYSSSVVRCRTAIWTTKVVKANGAYYNHNGWVFNNLTYLPSSRNAWGGNPLARPDGRWTAKDGHQWKTECGTAATGKNGCRSYVLTRNVVNTGGKFVSQRAWVFNNIVQFSTSTLPAQTTILPKAPPVANMPVEKPFKAPVAAAPSGKALNLAREAMWDRIARCESTNNWSINTGNGHYGGLQFNLQTWRSVNGQDFAAYPHQASRAEQITVANRLYAKRGTQPWSCA